MNLPNNWVRSMSEIDQDQREIEVLLEELRAQIQFQERAKEIVIRDSEILKNLPK
jgi:hypothetical protein